MTAKVSDIIKTLQRDYRPDDVVAYTIWSAQDVKSTLTDFMDLPGDWLDAGEMEEMLDRAEEETEGCITFEALEDVIEEYLEGRGGPDAGVDAEIEALDSTYDYEDEGGYVCADDEDEGEEGLKYPEEEE